MDDRLTQLAEEASAALRDDPELRLEVKAELAAHLEETAQALAEDGNDETQSIALAVKAFGPAPEVAQQLLAANHRRMKLRAFARLLLRAAIIPAAVILAIVIGYGRLVDLEKTLRIWNKIGSTGYYDNNQDQSIGILNFPELPFIPSALNQFDQLQKRFDQQKFLWGDHPENKIYFANYVSATISGRLLDPVSFAHLEQRMRQGEKADPDNALYNYCLARVLGRKAVEIPYPTSGQEPSGSVKINGLVFVLHDRQLLEREMLEMRRGLAKPFTSAYHQQMLQERLAELPFGENIHDATLKLAVRASVLLPEYAHYRQLAREIPYYGQVLLSEGRRQDAAFFLDGWQRLSVQILKGEDNLIGVLVAAACANITGEGAAEVYERNGEPERARQIRAQLARLTEACERWKNDRSNDILKEDAGFFTIIFPAKGKQFIQAGEFSPLHRLEYTIIEETALSLLVLLILLVLAFKMLTGLFWWLALRREGTTPLLLLPSARNSLRILFYGFALPIAVYTLYTRLPLLAGREQTFIVSWPRVGIEILFIGALLFVLPAALLSYHIRRQCRLSGIPVPARLEHWKALMALFSQGILFLVFLIAFCFLVSQDRDWLIYLSNQSLVAVVLGVGAILCLLLLSLNGGIIKISSPVRRYGIFYSSLNRTLVPLYAVAVILLSGIVYPCLEQEEAYWIRRDTLVFRQKGEGSVSMTPVEDRIVTELKRQMLQAAEQ